MQKITNKTWYVFLLPVFFVLHGYVENFGFISVVDCIVLCLYYLFLTAILWAISYLVFRKGRKASLFAFCGMCFYFFYSTVHTFLKSNDSLRLVSRHGLLLSTAIAFFVVLLIYLKRSNKNFYKITFFLNLLLFLYIDVDLILGVSKSLSHQKNSLSVYHFSTANDYKKCDTCKKPNIYLLLFDEYPSSLALKESYGFNNDLDSFLLQKNFNLQKKSRSNYNFTPFSMASLLNMSYLSGIQNVKAVTPEDYLRTYELIKEGSVMRYLDIQGYDIRNYSIFDLAGHPTLIKQSLLPLNTMLISERTIIPYLRRDIGWIFINRFPLNIFFKNHFLEELKNNEKIISLVKSTSAEHKDRPVFVYAHLELPHAPYFFNQYGQPRDSKRVYEEFVGKVPVLVTHYLDYVVYTNTRIRELINTILEHDPGGVILLLGDHGYRPAGKSDPQKLFQNMNAVYMPDKNYNGLYDSVTNVNEFRILLNKLFNQHFELLKDSTVVLRDR